jgi:hypothetical protein
MRQQLDELDALLQRMLALPINQLDEATLGPEPSARSTPAPAHTAPVNDSGRSPAMALLRSSGPAESPSPPSEPWDPGWNINLNPQQGSSILGPRSPAAAVRPPNAESAPAESVRRPETATVVRPESRPEQPVATPAPTPLPAFVSRSVGPPAPLVLQPLVWVNRRFDAIITSFGPAGCWLRSPAGRNLLGVSGLLMLLGGLAWGALDFFGWTS